MNLFGSNSKLILLHKNMDSPPESDSYDLILSPQFYILRREDLPFKYEFQARKIAPSILDEYLDENKVYSYIVDKDKENRWNFYAYSPEDIEEFLEKFNISSNQINQIYFADQLSDILIKAPISLDDKNALVLVDSYATVVPKDMLEGYKYITKITEKIRPKKGFKFQSTKKARKSLNGGFSKGGLGVAILIAILSGLYIFEGYGYQKELKRIEELIDRIYDNSPSLASKISRDSIKHKYTKIEKRQRRIRELIQIFSNLSSKKIILESLELKRRKMVAKYNILDKRELKRLKSLIATKNLNYKERDNYLIVTGEIR